LRAASAAAFLAASWDMEGGGNWKSGIENRIS